MRVRVLGSAAGGGFPQWNCGCTNCDGVRRGDSSLTARTQDSLALSADGDQWLVLNASPEIRAQIESFDRLHPRSARHSPIAGIVLTNGDLDHTLGLFSLRESHPIHVYATRAVRDGIVDGNIMHRTLERFAGQVTWHVIELGGPAVDAAGLSLQAFAVAGKRPVHLERAGDPTPEDNIGIVVRDSAGRRLAYVCGAASVDDDVRSRIEGVDALFFDGTFWSSDELTRPGLGKARAEDMAHWPLGGENGSVAGLASVRAGKKIFTHINNTNPILREGSVERRAVEAAGWIVARDGMEFELG